MSDTDESQQGDLQAGSAIIDYTAQQKEDDERYPNRPRNHSVTLPFRTLYQDLFDPLLANRKQPTSQVNRRKIGPKAVNSQSPHEIRRAIIERYISRWRKEVGHDFYPALRLIIPDKDRNRAMYGLKEKIIAKYIIKILKIDKNSDDGYNLLNWKQPGQNAARKAGDFPGRIHEVLLKRPFRVEPGNMTIEEVNERLDELSKQSKEEDQLSIMEQFYREMNPDELKWLVSIILRTVNVGATEKTFLNIWHPDAEVLFNVSSSLKKVCWELWNTSIRLEKDEGRGLIPGDCFQPQLAQFQPKRMNSIVARLQVTDEDPEFWIEEKLDGERMQLHIRTLQEEGKPPYKKFDFFSRKAKDYTYLYGSTVDDKKSALTQHLKDAFDEGVDSLILDGEMITWDPETDKMVPFGTLKTAALEQSRNPFSAGQRPLYRVFDILFLNDTDITRYDLRTRRQALERVVKPVDRRLEILEYSIGRTWDDIEHALRKVVAEASEGLVVKNPRSRYRLNDRNYDWVKVKPEYMEEFGESLDCLVIGGYYGSGRRGGGLSSFLCGLRVDDDDKTKGMSQKFLSFFKVGGGLTANDYANIRHHTEGKWIKWDAKNPPTEYIELGGGVQFQYERPDVWIMPEHSLVIQAKAASVGPSDEFAANLTLRFPRFQKLRSDKDWTTALSLQEFYDVRDSAETRKEENKNKAEQDKMKAETRKRHQRTDLRRPLQVVGYTQKSINEAAAARGDDDQQTQVFRGLNIFVMTEATEPKKKTKIELEEIVKHHGGHIIQTAEAPRREDGITPDEVVCIASKRSVKVASLIKKGEMPILKPAWLFDCIRQARTDSAFGLPELPLRPELDRHVFYSPDKRREIYEMEVDQYGDSFARDTSVEELRECMKKMKNVSDGGKIDGRLVELVSDTPGWLLKGTVLCFVDLNASVSARGQGKADLGLLQLERARGIARFAGATLAGDVEESTVTHVVVEDGSRNDEAMRELRGKIVKKKRLPRLVTSKWVEESWAEKTRLDEERFNPV